MKTKDIDKIEFNKFYKVKYSNKKNYNSIEAGDTETVNGYANLIIYSKIDILFNHIFDINKLISFMFKLDKKALYFFYNLDYDIKAFLRFFNDIDLITLLMQGKKIVINPTEKLLNKYSMLKKVIKIDLPHIKHKNIYIQYIRKKYFYISNFHNSIKFYDIMQFYNNVSLDNASIFNLNRCSICNKNLGSFIKKNDYLNGLNINCPQCKNSHKVLRKIKIKEEKYNDLKQLFDNEFLIYAKHDVYLTKKLALNLYKSINKTGLVINNPYSQATISKRYYFKHNHFIDNLMRVKLRPKRNEKFRKKFISYCLKSYSGGRFETFKKGSFNNNTNKLIYSIDINSAYPNIQKDLISFLKC